MLKTLIVRLSLNIFIAVGICTHLGCSQAICLILSVNKFKGLNQVSSVHVMVLSLIWLGEYSRRSSTTEPGYSETYVFKRYKIVIGLMRRGGIMQALLDWVEKRLPAMNAYKSTFEYPMPKNFNFWYLLVRLRCWCW